MTGRGDLLEWSPLKTADMYHHEFTLGQSITHQLIKPGSDGLPTVCANGAKAGQQSVAGAGKRPNEPVSVVDRGEPLSEATVQSRRSAR